MIRTFLLVFALIWLMACGPDEPDPVVEKCSDGFISSYNKIRDDFKVVYKSTATISDVQTLKSDIGSFLVSFRDVECTYNEVNLNITAELDGFLSDNEKGIYKLIDKIVYGNDDRVDVDDSTNESFKTWAKSTAAMIPNSNIDSDLILDDETIGESMNLCSGERFINQINPASCSGFLVRQNVLITAGHCITNVSDCNSNKWVFGFKRGVSQLSVDNVYSCKSIIKRELESSWGGDYGPDYAVIELDRPVIGRAPLSFRSSGKISSSANLVVIGHPSGLPLKIADGAKVRSNGEDDYFVANLDTFGGNSGSAVFNADTGEVEGILVRGDTDYVRDGSCYKVNVCANDGCDGESVTRMTVVQDIPVQTGPVDGGWSSWGSWGSCENSSQFRTRSCNSPAPSNGGANCDGIDREEQACLMYTKKQIFDGLFETGIFDEVKELIYHKAYREKDYMVLGKKFLGLCGMHVKRYDDPLWLSEGIVDCGSEMSELDPVYLVFEDLVLN